LETIPAPYPCSLRPSPTESLPSPTKNRICPLHRHQQLSGMKTLPATFRSSFCDWLRTRSTFVHRSTQIRTVSFSPSKKSILLSTGEVYELQCFLPIIRRRCIASTFPLGCYGATENLSHGTHLCLGERKNRRANNNLYEILEEINYTAVVDDDGKINERAKKRKRKKKYNNNNKFCGDTTWSHAECDGDDFLN